MFAQFLNKIFEIKQTLWLFPYKLRSERIIVDYLKKNARCIKLNIGSGSNLLSGWLNGEPWPHKGTVCIDASGRLPLENNSVHFINCEHLLEHLNYRLCKKFLSECFRILGKDGVLRISTPNLNRLIDMYLGNHRVPSEEILSHHRQYHNRTPEGMCEWFNDHMRLWGHKFIFDEPAFIELLKNTGFSRIIKCNYGESQHPELQEIERHDESAEWMRKAYVMIFEASK